ncbi:Sodium/hydrogen exchanger family-domain-containing protein [Lentinula raphanica]|nr:Sodium/hydrogen exchanger family-domain-containing protein [Lentinula raphanica]
MALDLLDITPPGVAYICVGGFVLFYCLLSVPMKEKVSDSMLHHVHSDLRAVFQLYLNEVVLGTVFGVIIGPFAANIFDPRSWSSSSTVSQFITLEVMRIVLATGLFAIGIELPRTYMWAHAKSLSAMVIPTMAAGWLIVGGIMKCLFPSLNYVSCLVIAACLTPTDPIVCATIVGGQFAEKHVSVKLRHILSAESAANDGLAYPFLSISLYLTVESSRTVAFGKWFIVGWLYQVILGVVLGATIGSYILGYQSSLSVLADFAMSFLIIGIAHTIGSDDLLAVFAAGSAMSWDGSFQKQIDGEVFSSVIDLVLNCACFIYIGAWLPFNEFNMPSLGIEPWRLILLFISIIFLRRIPPLLLLFKWVPEIETWQEALFSGHFALTELPTPHNPPHNQEELLALYIQPVVSFVVLGSIIIHGLSIPFFSFLRLHSRTLSLHSTLTLTNTLPDWIVWSRTKPVAAGSTNVAASSEQGDVERNLGPETELNSWTENPVRTSPRPAIF